MVQWIPSKGLSAVHILLGANFRVKFCEFESKECLDCVRIIVIVLYMSGPNIMALIYEIAPFLINEIAFSNEQDLNEIEPFQINEKKSSLANIVGSGQICD